MSYTITINSNSAQAESLVQFLKSLDFVDVKKKKEAKVATVAPKVLEEEEEEEGEDEDGIPLAYKDFILDLSKKTKKAAAKRFYEKVADNNIL